MTVAVKSIQLKFFEFLFGEQEGYVCIASASAKNKELFKQDFFLWPNDKEALIVFLERRTRQHHVWFCVNLLSKQERKKENCLPTNLIWADLDAASPSEIEPPPSCIIESSPNRFQAVWRISETVDPYVAESWSKKIAYNYRVKGVDPSGWDLTQLLRVPFTRNYKYDKAPKVDLIKTEEALLLPDVFENIQSEAEPEPDANIPDMPGVLDLPDASQVVYKYWHNLVNTAFKDIYEVEPDEHDDWSRIMWRLINICLEAGMSDKEAFAVALASKCNKYDRDNRPISFLWREVIKAHNAQSRLNLIVGSHVGITMPELTNYTPPVDDFITDYAEWGAEATDAMSQYHELGAFIVLSATLAQSLRLRTSYGDLVPNLWGLVLGDSTLTRKTTAMRMAMDLVQEIEQDMILATDGSVEGLLQGLSLRPGMTSIFYKDEVSGFFDSINRRDYLAGMPETLTHLYDVPRLFTRRLRKETITISNPIFIFFGGGIKEKVYSLVSDEYVLSGFLPRFLIVSGDADISKIRTTGPATISIQDKRALVLRKVADLYETYVRSETVEIAGQTTEIEKVTDVQLSDEAWEVYGQIEMQMVEAASNSPFSLLALPTFERLSRSLLKMAMLLAAARQEPKDNTVVVEAFDVEYAASFIQRWGVYTIDLIQSSGRSHSQKVMDRILKAIQREPGYPRGKLMQVYHLTKREMDDIQATLEDRGQIRIIREGKGTRLWPN